jgi:hypothetical protein
MNTTMATAAQAITIYIAATLGFNAADASAGGLLNDQSETNASLKYVAQFADLDLSRIEGATALYGRTQTLARTLTTVICGGFKLFTSMDVTYPPTACMEKEATGCMTCRNRESLWWSQPPTTTLQVPEPLRISCLLH